MGRFKSVALGKFGDFFARELRKQMLREVAKQGVAQTVDAFEMLEKQDQALQMRGGQLAVDAVKRVSDGVRQRLLLQEGLKVENVVAKAADLGVLRLRKAPDKEVNLARILRKISRNLLAHKRIRK